MKKVLLTGSSRLIGKEAIKPLLENGFEVYAMYSKNKPQEIKGVIPIKADLFNFDEIQTVLSDIKPQYLLHFAWVASGDYLTSETNYKLVDAGMNLLKAFEANGGEKAVCAGTCFEYEFKSTPLKETDKLNPKSVYAKCKNDFREKAQQFCSKTGLKFGWGRIFYVFGIGENEKRLTPNVINLLRKNKPAIINCKFLIKDYMYTKDIAEAFVAFLNSDVTGCVNICTGNPITLE